jgi:hypothetical protein
MNILSLKQSGIWSMHANAHWGEEAASNEGGQRKGCEQGYLREGIKVLPTWHLVRQCNQGTWRMAEQGVGNDNCPSRTCAIIGEEVACLFELLSNFCQPKARSWNKSWLLQSWKVGFLGNELIVEKHVHPSWWQLIWMSRWCVFLA